MQTTLAHDTTLDLSGEQFNNSTVKAVSPKSKTKAKNAAVSQPQQSLFFALAIAMLVAAIVLGAWLCDVFVPLQAVLYGTRWTGADAALVAPPVWIGATVFAFVSLVTAFLIERDGARSRFFYIVGFFLFWFVGAAVAAQTLRIDILAVPTIFAALFTFLAIQIRPFLQIEAQLTEGIRRLALRSHILEGKKAGARLTSGLEVLQTVLPVDEIVVFKLDKNRQLTAAGRSRDSMTDKIRSKPKQSEWREGVELCDEAIKTGKPTTQKISGESVATRVAVPLIHENCMLGALLVRFRENYEPADNNVLIAFAAQFARNFQRNQTRELDREPSIFDFLSRTAAQQRLESFRVVSGLLTEQQFGSLAFSEMVEGYAIAYLDGTLAYINRAMMKAAQITSDRASQLDLFSLLERFKGGVFDEPRIAIRRVMQTGESYRHEIFIEERNQTLDLQISIVHETAEGKAVHESMALTDTPLCFIVTVRDISAQKENEKLRSDMVSLMSHELRTPITSINGFAELLILEDNIPEESREFLNIISTESQRLSKMLNTFLAMSKLEQGDKREVIKIPIRLDSIVHEVLINLQSEARKKRIRLVEQANSHLPPVVGDKGLMTKVVSHLIDNAIRYSPERTTVTISTVLEADAVRVIVEDRGYGIPNDSLEKIWEKFYRVPREGQDKNETSTGLGLSFVKEVVEQHGGSVSVESEPNQGSKFSFTLPRL